MNAFFATICLLLAVAAACSAAPSKQTKEQIIAQATEVVAACSKEFNVPAEYATKLASAPNTEAVQCYTKCLATKLDYLVDNQVQVERVVEINRAYGFEEAVIERKLAACKDTTEVKDGSCASLYNAFVCYEKA